MFPPVPSVLPSIGWAEEEGDHFVHTGTDSSRLSVGCTGATFWIQIELELVPCDAHNACSIEKHPRRLGACACLPSREVEIFSSSQHVLGTCSAR